MGPQAQPSGYLAAALAVSVAITVAVRAVPFAVTSLLRQSAVVADIGRWMPLGAIAIMATSCVTRINVNAPNHGLPELAGLAITTTVHLWRHNLLLSLVTGTAVCLALANSPSALQ